MRAPQWPDIVPVFPLEGGLLLPGGHLPLNVFEPRYLELVETALASDRIIAITQPRPDKTHQENDEPSEQTPPLYGIACAGRLVEFHEPASHRFLIVLRGMLRCQLAEEQPETRGFRSFRADWQPFLHDLHEEDASIDRERFFFLVEQFLARQNIEINAEALRQTSDKHLVSSIAIAGPFESAEKQALLEARTLHERAKILMTLLEMKNFEGAQSQKIRQ